MNGSKLLKVSISEKKTTLSSNLEIIDENEKNNLVNLDFEVICSNWISVNQFLSDWFIKKIRPEAIDMNLCLVPFDNDSDVTRLKHQKPSTRNDSKNWIFENWYGKSTGNKLAKIG